MATFYRRTFEEFWLTLKSNEVLGLLDGNYLEDYFGVDGQVSLLHVNSGIRFPVQMLEVFSDTPNVAHDSFKGFRNLSDLPDGEYEVQARVKDTLGNYTIIGAVAAPFGNERIINLPFSIVDGVPVVPIISMGSLALQEGFTIPLQWGANFHIDVTHPHGFIDTCFSAPNITSNFNEG